MKFKMGNVVQLTCGSCDMTVSDIRADGLMTLSWTDFDGVPRTISVDQDCLFLAQVTA